MAAAASSAPIPIPPNNAAHCEHPTELLRLIAERRWEDVVSRCRTDPHEVGSAPRLRNSRGYSALHALVAYNRTEPGEDLAPPIRAILRAADEIDYGAEYRVGGGSGNDDYDDDDGEVAVAEDESRANTNEIVERGGEEDGETKEATVMAGSWRLLVDQENKARWSPLHLTCVNGGITHGKIAVVRALLRMDDSENENDDNKNDDGQGVLRERRRRALTLLDRQDRNVLHHLLTSLVPSRQACGDVRFLISTSPSLLFGRDHKGRTPIAYVVSRLTELAGSRRRHYMNRYGNVRGEDGIRANYDMLRLLVLCMERKSRGWGHVPSLETRADVIAPPGKLGVVLFTPDPPAPRGPPVVSVVREDSPLKEEIRVGDRIVAVDDEDVRRMSATDVSALLAGKSEQAERRIVVSREVDGSRNTLQRACLIPRKFCPADGSLLVYLSSPDATKWEGGGAGGDNTVNMASEADERGNRALHLFLANESYVGEDDEEPVKPSATAGRRKGRDEVIAASGHNDAPPRGNAECRIATALLESHPAAATHANDAGRTPLAIAMMCDRRQAVSLLVLARPETAILDEDGVSDINFFAHVLGCVAVPRFCEMGKIVAGDDASDDEARAEMDLQCFRTMFYLIRASPDVVSLAGRRGRSISEPNKSDPVGASKKKKWYSKLNPFS